MADQKTPTVEESLKPCPFCGGEPYLESYGPGGFSGSVYCSTEGCAADGYNASSEKEAIDRWNRRTP